MRKLIIDCDNTFSVRGCDIDDGLAIIYALANMDVESLKNGFLFGDGEEREVVIPKVKKEDDYIEHVYEKFSLFGK